MKIPWLQFAKAFNDASGAVASGITNYISGRDYFDLVTEGAVWNFMQSLPVQQIASIEELFGIYSVPACQQASILGAIYDYHTTGFATQIEYYSAGTQPCTASTIGMITSQKTINMEFLCSGSPVVIGYDKKRGGVYGIDANIYQTEFNTEIEFTPYTTGSQQYFPGYSYPQEDILHLIYFYGQNLSAITSIVSNRYLPHSNQFMSVAQPGHIYELRIPTGCTSLNRIIIKNEGLSNESVNSILVTLDAIGNEGGYIDLSDYKIKGCHCNPIYSNAKPCVNGVVAKQRLLNKRWTVITN